MPNSGLWNCNPCKIKLKKSNSTNISQCCICSFKGGALKRVSHSHRWAHVTCTKLIPETSFEEEQTLEHVIGVDNIKKGRWDLHCSICSNYGREVAGACIKCPVSGCTNTFHPLCCSSNNLVRMEQDSSGKNVLLGFCAAHIHDAEVVIDTNNDLPVFVDDKIKEEGENIANIFFKSLILDNMFTLNYFI
jgi:NuA3 HAT complex component NTO1